MAGGGAGGHGRISWAPWHRSWASPSPAAKRDQVWPPLVPGPQGSLPGGVGHHGHLSASKRWTCS
eukprot:4273367-Pyramimonas_sp.AAC.1